MTVKAVKTLTEEGSLRVPSSVIFPMCLAPNILVFLAYNVGTWAGMRSKWCVYFSHHVMSLRLKFPSLHNIPSNPVLSWRVHPPVWESWRTVEVTKDFERLDGCSAQL